MTIESHHIPDEAIIVSTLGNPYHASDDIHQMFEDITMLRDEFDNDTYCVIVDARGLDINFSQMVVTLAEVRKAVTSMPDSPKKVILSLVGIGGILEMVTNALAQSQYGEWEMPLFNNMEQALEFARRKTIAV